jgi:hypothetical protein
MLIVSCGKNKADSDNNNQVFTIKELSVIDSVHLEQIISIISPTDCFIENGHERHIISLIYDQSSTMYISLVFYIGYDKEDLKQIYGCFYRKVGNDYFFFVVDKSDYIPRNIYKFTGKEIDVKKYMDTPFNSSDAGWYLKNCDGKLEFICTECFNE